MTPLRGILNREVIDEFRRDMYRAFAGADADVKNVDDKQLIQELYEVFTRGLDKTTGVSTPRSKPGSLREKVAAHQREALTLKTAEDQHGKFWALNVLDRKDSLDICYCCGDPSTGRSSINVWGTVCDFQTCVVCHIENDGNRTDSIPQVSKSTREGPDGDKA